MGLVPRAMAGSFAPNMEFGADAGGLVVAEFDHFAELEARIDVEQGERDGRGEERLLRQAEHDGRVFADAVQHDRALKLARDLAENVDALCLKQVEMGERWGRGKCGGHGNPDGDARAKGRLREGYADVVGKEWTRRGLELLDVAKTTTTEL